MIRSRRYVHKALSHLLDSQLRKEIKAAIQQKEIFIMEDDYNITKQDIDEAKVEAKIKQ